MSRYSYDDMPSGPTRRRGGSRKFTVIFVSILVIAVCAIIYIAFSPSDDAKKEVEKTEDVGSSDDSLMGLEIPDVNEVVIELEEPEEEETLPVEEEAEEVDDEDRFLSIFDEYMVKSGDTLNSISLHSGISPQTIANVNAITDMTDIQKGMVLYIPPMDGQVYSLKAGDTLSDILERYNPSMPLDEFLSLNHLESEECEPGMRVFIPSFESEDAEENVLFIRPVDGLVKYGYGEVYNERKLDGIAIEVIPGSAVRSIATGFVADVGADPVFGRYVTVIHENGYKSHYYSLETVAVRIGDTLQQGSIIGSVGTSSRYFGSPCLFFRLEQGVLKLDPMLFL